jgi:hypothetical protein
MLILDVQHVVAFVVARVGQLGSCADEVVGGASIIPFCLCRVARCVCGGRGPPGEGLTLPFLVPATAAPLGVVPSFVASLSPDLPQTLVILYTPSENKDLACQIGQQRHRRCRSLRHS